MTPFIGTELIDVVKTHGSDPMRVTDDHVQFLMYQIFRGLKYVHSAGIIHGVCVQPFNPMYTRDKEVKHLKIHFH